jgi:dephospho-CoA kinase
MRLIERRGITAQEADRMMAAQMPAEAKRARAGHVIRNDGTLDDLETRAAEVWKKIVGRANECA